MLDQKRQEIAVHGCTNHDSGQPGPAWRTASGSRRARQVSKQQLFDRDGDGNFIQCSVAARPRGWARTGCRAWVVSKHSDLTETMSDMVFGGIEG